MNRAFSYQSAACRPAYPVLPHGLERSDVERLLTRCGDVFGLNPATIRILLVMIQHTRPADWTSPSTAPVCFAAQTVIAEACCRSTRAVRAAETQLSKAGIILRRVGAGGARGRWGHFTLGLDFSPLIERVDELARVEEERLALTKQRTILKKQVSAARRLARSAIDDLAQSCPEADDLPALRLILESWPRRYDALPVQALEAMLQRTEALYRKAVSALEMQSKTSGLSAGKDRPLQEQIEDQICSCNREPQAQTQQDPR
ncbi:helix-turn-helix domain-containing protein, partial [Terrabacter sp. 2RAF25]|uniref:helix-turn-helix domain-containing protein n=1 Tax=Terrabacter sp. 2RAF25 TaxID=3232998 RepID=UPI003F973DF6